MRDKELINIISILPGVNDKWEPAPELLTEEEAIRFLRLDLDGPKDPSKTLAYYRGKKLLCATRVGRKLRYQRTELLKFLDKLTERTEF